MKTILFSLVLISNLLLNTLVYAQSAGISKQEAVDIATQNHPGRVLAVNLKAGVYRVKILNDSGKVRVVKVDATRRDIKSGSKP